MGVFSRGLFPQKLIIFWENFKRKGGFLTPLKNFINFKPLPLGISKIWKFSHLI